MPESIRTRLTRYGYNFFPAYRGTGARVRYIADDFREIHVELPLNWRTRNYVGTIFGGSMFGAVDPMYMIMLIKALGPQYAVWDRAASIQFRKPGRGTLRATFRLLDEEIDGIREALVASAVTERTYEIDLIDRDGIVCASVQKTIHIRKRDAERKRP